MEKFKKDKIKHDDNSRYKDSKLSIFPLIESIKIYISKSYRNFKADDNRSFTQSYFSDAVKLLLDTYPNASAAYSLRKLSSSYQGPAIRVRRSSDNQEQDIYFDSLSNLDTNSLTSFVGSENLILYSEQFDNPYWIKTNSSVTANANISPDGITSSDLIYPLSSGADRRIQKSIPVVNGTTYTVSVFAKASGLNWIRILEPQSFINGAWFNLSNGTIGTIQSGLEANIQDFGNGWYRCSVTKTVTSTVTGQVYIQIVDNNNSQTVTVNGTSGVLLWGAQLNSGPIQSYAATTTAIAGDGFVTTWYDQSGNSRNATQSTAASQPQIVTSGVVSVENNKPSLFFNGSSHRMAFSQIEGVTGMTLVAVSKYNVISTNTAIYELSSPVISYKGLPIRDMAIGTRVGKSRLYYENGNGLQVTGSDVVVGTTYLQFGYVTSQYAGISTNGELFTGAGGLNNSIVSHIAHDNTTAAPTLFSGEIQEILVYSYDLSPNRLGVESSINQYYSIY